jgi:hypothetical protein
MSDKKAPAPGDGLRSLRTTGVFRVVNFELYAKPVSITSKPNILRIFIFVRTVIVEMNYISNF